MKSRKLKEKQNGLRFVQHFSYRAIDVKTFCRTSKTVFHHVRLPFDSFVQISFLIYTKFLSYVWTPCEPSETINTLQVEIECHFPQLVFWKAFEQIMRTLSKFCSNEQRFARKRFVVFLDAFIFNR